MRITQACTQDVQKIHLSKMVRSINPAIGSAYYVVRSINSTYPVHAKHTIVLQKEATRSMHTSADNAPTNPIFSKCKGPTFNDVVGA